jgi:hydroxymethylpyrimidine pyrophosphatase-like HAD family hydrolase
MTSMGLQWDEAMVIGDSANDIPIMERAAWSVAVENASNEVKKVCNVVAPSNKSAGVAFAIYGLIFDNVNARAHLIYQETIL